MSNTIHIQKTIFQNINDNGNVTEETYGIRIFDNEGSDYENFVETKEALIAIDDEDLIEYARRISDRANDMIDYAIREKIPLLINSRDAKFE